MSKKLISAFLALIFLINSLCPAWAQREGNYGEKSSAQLFSLAALSGLISYAPSVFTSLGSVVFDTVDMYMFLYHYNEYGEKMISFKVGGEEVVIGKGQLYAMISSVVVSALVGYLAGLAAGGSAAAAGAAEGAAQGGTSAATSGTVSAIVQAIVDMIKKVFNFIKSAIEMICGKGWLHYLIGETAANLVIRVLSFIPKLILEVIKDALCGIVRVVGNTLTRIWNFIKGMFTHPIQTLKDLFKDTWKAIKDTIIGDAKSMSEIFAKNQHFMAGQALRAAFKEGAAAVAKEVLSEIVYLALVDVPAAVARMCAKEAAETVAEKKWGWDKALAAIFGSMVGNYAYVFSYGFLVKISAALIPFVDWTIGPDGSLIVNRKVDANGKLVDNQKAVDSAEAAHSNNAYADFFADIFVNSFVTGYRGVSSLGLAPLTDAMAKIYVLKAMHYKTYRGTNNGRIWDNVMKMSIAESISNVAEGTINNIPSIYKGYDAYVAQQQRLGKEPASFDDYMAEKTGSLIANKFLSQLGSLAGEIAWAKYCKKNDISQGSAYELMHLAASSIIGSVISGGNPLQNFGINLWRAGANSAPLFIPTQWYNLRIPAGTKPDKEDSGTATGEGKTEGEIFVRGGEFNYTNPILLQGRYSERLYAYVDSNARQSGWGSVSNPILVTANTITHSLNSAANSNLANAFYNASKEPQFTLRYGKGPKQFDVVNVSDVVDISKSLAARQKELQDKYDNIYKFREWIDRVKQGPVIKQLSALLPMVKVVDNLLDSMRNNIDKAIGGINAELSQKQFYLDQIMVRNIDSALSAYQNQVSSGGSPSANSGPLLELLKTKEGLTNEAEKLKKEKEGLIKESTKKPEVIKSLENYKDKKISLGQLPSEARELVLINNRITKIENFVRRIDSSRREIEKGAGKSGKEAERGTILLGNLKIGEVLPVSDTVQGNIRFAMASPVKPDKMTSKEGALVTVEKIKSDLSKYFAPAGMIRDEVTFFVPKEILDKYNNQLEASALEAYHVDTGKQKIEAGANKMLMDYLLKTYPDTFKEYFSGSPAGASAAASGKPGFTLTSSARKGTDTFSFDWFRSDPEALKVAKIEPVADKDLYNVTLAWKNKSGEEEKITCKVPKAEVESGQRLFERCGEIDAYHYYLKDYIAREMMVKTPAGDNKVMGPPAPSEPVIGGVNLSTKGVKVVDIKMEEPTDWSKVKPGDLAIERIYNGVSIPMTKEARGGPSQIFVANVSWKDDAGQKKEFSYIIPGEVMGRGQDAVKEYIISQGIIKAKTEPPAAPAVTSSASRVTPVNGVDMNFSVNPGNFRKDTTGELEKLHKSIIDARKDNPGALSVPVK